MKRIGLLFLLCFGVARAVTSLQVNLSTFPLTFTNGSATITSTANSLVPTCPIKLAAPQSPFVAGTTYYVVNPTTNGIQLSATLGGSAITALGSGSDTGTSCIIYGFHSDYTVGQFANLDWYVYNSGSGIVVDSITPASTWTVKTSANVTITQANPGVVTWTAHGMVVNRVLMFADNGDTLPSGLAFNTPYYVKTVVDANNLTLSATNGGTAIATTSAGSGTHVLQWGRVINGSTVNPSGLGQGWDTSMFVGTGPSSGGLGPCYISTLNVARPNGNDLSSGNPATIPVGSSIVSCISEPYDSNGSNLRVQLYDACVLTVVASQPAAGDFRPPIWTTDKTGGPWNISQLNYSILRNLSTSGITGVIDQTAMEQSLTRNIFFQLFGATSNAQYSSPLVGNPSGASGLYGREIEIMDANFLLFLNLNYTTAAKQLSYIRFVQMGIDLYGVVRAGGTFPALTGINGGRKSPVVMAGLALGDSAIAAWGNKALHNVFSEDLQTFYVQLSDVGRALSLSQNRPRVAYQLIDVGNPEYGEQHAVTPNLDGRNWDDLQYRDIVGSGMVGQALGFELITGGYAAWNNPVLFDYADRYRPNEITNGATFIPVFHKSMFDAYRTLSTTPPATTRWNSSEYLRSPLPNQFVIPPSIIFPN